MEHGKEKGSLRLLGSEADPTESQGVCPAVPHGTLGALEIPVQLSRSQQDPQHGACALPQPLQRKVRALGSRMAFISTLSCGLRQLMWERRALLCHSQSWS